MAKSRSGSIVRKTDSLKVRVTIVDDQGKTRRPWLSINPAFDDEKAKRTALKVAKEMDGKPYQPKLIQAGRRPTGGITVDEYFDSLWAPSRKGRVKSIRMDRSRYRKHISPLIGKKLLTEVSRDDLRDVVQALDRKAVERRHLKGRERFGPKTANNVWAIVTKMFDDAVESKVKELRLLTTNPATNVKPPDPPPPIEKQWLYPAELRQLLSCRAVPLSWRRLYAAAVYSYARPGEVLALLWGRSIDLAHGIVRINRSYDHIADAFNEHTKTEDSRAFAIEPVLRPLLEKMWREYPRQGLVFDTVRKLAETLRAHLLVAGVDREALHVERKNALRLRFHDLRATGITYMAIRGDTDNDVRERAGHADFKTTQVYIRRGHLAAGGSVGDPYAPLPVELFESSIELSGVIVGDQNLSSGDAGSAGAGEGIRILFPSAEGSSLPRTPGEAPEETGHPGLSEPRETRKDDSEDDSDPPFPGVAQVAANLHTLAELDPAGARPGLAVVNALDAVLRGDVRTARTILRQEARAADAAPSRPRRDAEFGEVGS
jgi:integrase